MPTIQQLVRKGLETIAYKSKSRALDLVLRSVAYALGCIQPLLRNQLCNAQGCRTSFKR